MSGGFIGVDIFFVISGFLISTIIFENLNRGTFNFSEFYARRIKRIFPALILVLIATYGFGWFVLIADEYKQLGKHIAAGAGFISNFVLWSESGYFDNTTETKPLLHLWSLGIEEQFYIVWPFILWFAWKRKFNLLTLTIVVALVSFALNLKGIKHDSVATFYSPQTRFWELLSGSTLAWFTLYKKSVYETYKLRIDGWVTRIFYRSEVEADGRIISNFTSIVGCLLLVFGFWRITKDLSFPGNWAVLPVLGAILIILAGPTAWVNRNILSNKIAVWFGLISFPLYLWHWPLLSFARIVIGETPSLNIRISAVAISVFLAWVTFKLVERPIRLGRHTYNMVAVLVVLMAAVGTLGYYTFASNGFPNRVINKDSDVFNYSSHWTGWQTCQIVPNTSTDGGCQIIDNLRPIELVVVGDSHAGHLVSGLRSLVSLKDSNIAVMLHAGCFPTFPVMINGKEFLDCPNNLIGKALDYAIETDSVKTIVLSGYAALKLQVSRFHENQHLSAKQIDDNYEILKIGLINTLTRLTSSTKKVIFVVDNPELLNDPKSCVLRLGLVRCDLRISKQSYLDRNRLYIKLIEELKTKFPSVQFTNSIDFFCNDDFCYGDDASGLWYATRDHLTPHGSRKFIQSFEELFSF